MHPARRRAPTLLCAAAVAVLAACVAEPPTGSAAETPRPGATTEAPADEGRPAMKPPQGFGAMKPPSPPPDEADACGAAALQPLVGQPLSAFDPGAAKGRVRIIRPGTMVTMDYSAARMNVSVDEAGIITRIHCG